MLFVLLRFIRIYHLEMLGLLGLDLGVYGAPETFLVDGHGIVRWKHVGPLTDAIIQTQLLPLLGKISMRVDEAKRLHERKSLRRFIAAFVSFLGAYAAGIAVLFFITMRAA